MPPLKTMFYEKKNTFSEVYNSPLIIYTIYFA